jgi:hypothetical protein
LEKTLKAHLPELEKAESQIKDETVSPDDSKNNTIPQKRKIENLAMASRPSVKPDIPEDVSTATPPLTSTAKPSPKPGIKPTVVTNVSINSEDNADPTQPNETPTASDETSNELNDQKKIKDDIEQVLEPILKAEDQIETTESQTTENLKDSQAEQPQSALVKVEGHDRKFFVQLGSVKSKSRAEQEWKRLSGKYPQQLGKQPYRVVEADLGSRGIFYRVQAGPYEQLTARSICQDLKQAGKTGGCLVVAP